MCNNLIKTKACVLFLALNCSPVLSSHLERGASGPVAVAVQLALAGSRAELDQLVPLQLVGGERRQQLEEGAARHGGDVQVVFHQVAHSAGLGKSGWDWVDKGLCTNKGLFQGIWLNIE